MSCFRLLTIKNFYLDHPVDVYVKQLASYIKTLIDEKINKIEIQKSRYIQISRLKDKQKQRWVKIDRNMICRMVIYSNIVRTSNFLKMANASSQSSAPMAILAISGASQLSSLLMYSITLVLSALMAVSINRFCRFLDRQRYGDRQMCIQRQIHRQKDILRHFQIDIKIDTQTDKKK